MASQDLTRRHWLKNCSLLLACGGWPFDPNIARRPPWLPQSLCGFSPSKKPRRERKALQSLTEPELADLARAYQLWRSCAGDWGPARQKDLHLFSCQEPWRVHSSPYATFVLWHRAFLYFHERNLAYTLNPHNPSFRLPYWNWDLPDCLKQAPFCRPADPAKGNLFARINPNLRFRALSALDVSDLSSLVSMNRDQFIGELLAFHASVHQRLGDDMFNPTTSAEDPVFYPFHVNFDRVMAAYQKFGPKDSQISSDGLPDMFFFDLETCALNPGSPNKGWVTVRPADFLDAEQLGYSYNFSGLSQAYDIHEISNSPEPSVRRFAPERSVHRLKAPASRLQIAFYDIALPDGSPGIQWRASISGSGKSAGKDFTMHMPDHGRRAMEPSFPYLRIDVTDKIDFDDLAHTNLQFSLQRSGVAPTKLEARKIVFQIWTPK